MAVIDVASGRIEALAGALSPCTREEYDGPGRSKSCDKRLPYVPRYRPDALLNAAVFHDAMPASVIKPIMAEAFLTDPDVGARWLAAERLGEEPSVRNDGGYWRDATGLRPCGDRAAEQEIALAAIVARRHAAVVPSKAGCHRLDTPRSRAMRE